MTTTGFDKEKIINYYNRDHSEEDKSYITEIFCDELHEEEIKSLLSGQFDELLKEEYIEKRNLDHILYRIHYEINTKSKAQKEGKYASIVKWAYRIAGMLLLPLAFLIGLHMNKETQLKKEAWVEIKAPAWTRAQFSLPDGTTGWLNSSSSIKYKEDFIHDRQIALNGEAFFDVFKDKHRPFVVTTNDISVEVLGTRFNIASYDNENDVEVILEEGKLLFNTAKRNKFYIMHPNDLVTFNKTNKDFTTEVVDPNKYLSWTDGMLVFRNDPLDVIARRLERWYNIDVEVDKTLTEDLRLRATFKDESLEEVLGLLKRSLPIDYKIEIQDLKPNEIYAKKKVIILPRTH
ncbi:MAG: FecR domain-containing protein [Lentimicrobiaceae bacterium]|jgi:ferric-dicitrate binding protein FerR (iron transport regulator)